MELYTLNINVNKQRLSFGENKPEFFSGDQSIDFVEFTFEDDMWNFPNIWAIFSRFKGTSYQVALEDNKVMIPAEVMQKKGYVYIGLMATDGENVQTSSVLQYSIGQGSTNVDAITPSASIYEQFLADLDAYQTAVADLDDIESRITTAEGNVSIIEQAVTDLNEQLDDINVDISTINGQITTIQNNIGTAQGDIVSIQNWINTLNGQVAGLDTAVGTLSNRVTALQGSVTSLEGRLTTVGNTLTDFEGRLTTAGTTLTNLEGSISDAENDIQTVQDDIETIQSDIEDIQTAIEQNNVVTDVTAEGISLVDNHIADLSFMCVTDTASGDIASFPDGSGLAMKKAEVSLEPIQDLHGYDKPWPGGSGVNKFPNKGNGSVNGVTYTTNEDGSVSLSGTCTSSVNLEILGHLSAGLYKINDFVVGTFPDNGSARVQVVAGSKLISKANRDSVDGWSSAVNVEEDIEDAKFRIRFDNGHNYTGCKLYPILAESTYTGAYVPYSNICPIDGYEDVGVSVRGVNMWDEEWEYGRYSTSTGEADSSGGVRSKNFIPVFPSTTYFLCCDAISTNDFRVLFYDADKNFINANGWAYGNTTFVTRSNAHYVKFFVTSTSYGTTYNNDISINYPSTDHDYHAYAGNDYTTDLEQTVYGGTVDLASGRLVVDKAYRELKNATGETWYRNIYNANEAAYSFRTQISNMRNMEPTEDAFVVNSYSFFQFAWAETNKMSVMAGSMNYLYFRPPNTSVVTLDDWKAWITNNPIQVVYPLATPQTYQLTPQQIQTLVGANNVWSEDGTIEVEYIANLKDYIDKKINA